MRFLFLLLVGFIVASCTVKSPIASLDIATEDMAPSGHCGKDIDRVFTIKKKDILKCNIGICNSAYLEHITYTLEVFGDKTHKKYKAVDGKFQQDSELQNQFITGKINRIEVTDIKGYYMHGEPRKKHAYLGEDLTINLTD